MSSVASKITTSSTAEYFSKNLQQVGFSSGTKAVLTTLKEAVDNSLDACEDAGILPEISVEIEKLGPGTQKKMDQIRIKVTDNGPGIRNEDVVKVYGEYLASSKFGRGRCSRGQQGIGISAATTWAQLTTAKGVNVCTKVKGKKQALQGSVEVDIKKNIGVIKNKKMISWDRPHGTSVEFFIDGRLQIHGEGGVLTYLSGTSLVNPHLTLTYKLNQEDAIHMDRVSEELIGIPAAVPPHPHTMKLGEFMAHSTLFGKSRLDTYLKRGFSRITDQTLKDLTKKGTGVPKSFLAKSISSLKNEEMKNIYKGLQDLELKAPSTRSVLRVGEEGLAKSIERLGEIDFFSVVSRKPRICDAKPVVVEVAIARLINSKSDADDPVTILRFANRVPLQFDKGGCALAKAIESVNWKSYGLNQPKRSLPQGPYIIAISVVSPFIKFKNASKETVDSSEELVDELRLTLMQAGQRLSRFIKRELRANDLEKKKQHIEKFAPILIETIGRITSAPKTRLKKAETGLMKILGREADDAEGKLKDAEAKKAQLLEKRQQQTDSASKKTSKKKRARS